MTAPPCSIRWATPNDGAAVADIYATYVRESAFTFDETPLTPDQMSARITDFTRTYPWLIAQVGNTVAGYACATRHLERAAYRWSTNVTVYLHNNFRGRRIGQALYEKLLPLLQRQGFINAYALITLPNDPSVKLHEKMGFASLCTHRHAGYKLGHWHDVGWWIKKLNTPHPTDTPREITAWPELMKSL